MVRRWEGGIDAGTLNEAMLKWIRETDGRASTSEAEQARLAHMSHQELHFIHHRMKSLSLMALVNWANGKRLDAAFVLGRMIRLLRKRVKG